MEIMIRLIIYFFDAYFLIFHIVLIIEHTIERFLDRDVRKITLIMNYNVINGIVNVKNKFLISIHPKDHDTSFLGYILEIILYLEVISDSLTTPADENCKYTSNRDL